METSRWDLIQEIFLEAVDLQPPAREVYLATACGSDEELQREVRSLIDSEAASENNINIIISTTAEALLEGSAVGQLLGAYRVVRQIGRGGMGTVYLAYCDGADPQQKVAIKLMRRGLDTDDLLARFRAERQILANLDHPNCTRLIDGGSASDGRPFLVMEYVEGLPIDVYCRENRLTVQERCALFIRVCEAVSYAHRNLIVHRDIKPGNILVTPAGVPKLLDFGVAKLLRAGHGSTTTLTRTAGALFTPAYASPEQLMELPITTATDTYSLGAVLYTLLTECKPYPASTESRRLDAQARSIPPQRPSVVAAPEHENASNWRRHLSGDLDAIVLMAMRPEPERRYPSVDALNDDVQRFLDGRPVTARVDSLSYRTGKWLRRHYAIAASILLLVVAGVFAGLAWQRQARIAEARRLYVAAREDMAQFQEYPIGRSMQLLEESLRLDPDYAPAHAALAEAAFWLGSRKGQDREQWNRIATNAVHEALRIDPNNAEAHERLGLILVYLQWNWEAGEKELRRAAAAEPWRVAWQVSLVQALTILGRFDDALRTVDAAEKIRPNEIEYLVQRTLLLIYAKRPAEAVPVAQQVLARDPNGHEAFWVMGMALEQNGQVQQAIDVLRRGVSEEHRDTRVEAALGHAYGMAGQREAALGIVRLIEHPPAEVANYLCAVCAALIYAGVGDGDQAIAWLERAKERHDASLPFVPADPRYARIEGDPRFQAIVRWVRTASHVAR